MVAATRNLCEAARRLRIQRVIHLSSMAVYGDATGSVDEESPLRPVGAYAEAKAECEAIVRDYIATGGDAVVMRPGCVYGPGGEQWVGRIARWLRKGRLGQLGDDGNGFCNLTFNPDLAQAVIAALVTPAAAKQFYNVADPEPGTWNEYFARLGAAIGVPDKSISSRRIRWESTYLAPPIYLLNVTIKRLGFPTSIIQPPITRSLVRLWKQRLRLDSTKANTLLGFARTPPAQALLRSSLWFLTHETVVRS
jgi:nucleoside-diphosphate-sugar epimerase